MTFCIIISRLEIVMKDNCSSVNVFMNVNGCTEANIRTKICLTSMERFFRITLIIFDPIILYGSNVLIYLMY